VLSKVFTHLLVLLVTVATTLGAMPLDPQYVNMDAVKNAGLVYAKTALDSEKCEKAFQLEFHELNNVKEIFLRDAFEMVEIMPIPMFSNNSIKGAVNCDVSSGTVLVSEYWIGWGGAKKYSTTLVHEFVHILQCKEVFEMWGTYANLTHIQRDKFRPVKRGIAIKYEQELEYSAYRIAGACTNAPVPEIAQRKTKEKK